MSHKSFCVTINNYTELNIERIKAIPCQRIIAGFEACPTTGTPHVQMAIVFKKPMRFKAVLNALGGGGSARQMKGTWADQEYCFKEGKVIRMEDNTKQGARTDLVAFQGAIKRKASDLELCEKYTTETCKYPRFIGFYRKALQREAAYAGFKPVCVSVFVGPAGCGKNKLTTKWSFEDQFVLALSEPKQWFDDYQGQDSILMHEYAGQWPLSKFLTRTDGASPRYEEVKGCGVYLNNSNWVFTTNVHPRDWYEFTEKQIADTIDKAFWRRITAVMVWDGSKFVRE
ncbi:replication-associated protein [Antarctic virus 1_I_CPGEORsw001Ad]|nr:replication-associated protein [Antarctic virus 1_I_CPGEORsw001Ad]QNG41087.1 replication-associated protein [Antarctic virus 1_I_CPGEORsw002Ad]